MKPYSVGDAFNYGWTKFQANVGPILLGLLGLMVVSAIVFFIWNLITGAILSGFSGSDAGLVFLLVSSAFSALLGGVIQVFVQAAITRGALAITYGRQIEISTLLNTDQIPQILLGGLIIGLATAVGTLLCFIPGLIVGFFSQFFVHFALDKQLPAVEAIKASFAFVNQNLGTLIGFYLATIVAAFVGALLCGVGLLVAIPVIIIGQAYTYRVLQGEPVAP
ncbi:hypothetical protein [Euzebya rosea]|uniref:hypothetical protein n=1 Tax=Euzebya rosea TaxID=2052804 RepID=UPI000D3E7BF6|nr:hypothetical protein [Euzebya rosea]